MLAFSESGSRSQFWPLSTATAAGDTIVLNASKSWVTSAGEADSYAWISQPLETPAGAKLWLAPADAAGLAIAAPFDGLGLRSNASSPDTATDVVVQSKARLGDDGGGLDIALPTFQILNTSCSLGLMDAKIAKTIAPATSARFEHLDQSLVHQPVSRQYLAVIFQSAGAALGLVDDAVAALTQWTRRRSVADVSVEGRRRDCGARGSEHGDACRRRRGVSQGHRDRALLLRCPPRPT